MRSSRWLVTLLGIPAIILLTGLTWAAFAQRALLLSHDEAEHLHVVFALEQGVRPYIDFIENHPVLPHILLGGLRNDLGIGSVSGTYWLAKGVLAAHFVATLLVIIFWLRRHRTQLQFRFDPIWTFPVIFVLLGCWNPSGEWVWGHESLWQIRPDWLYIFWTIVALVLATEGLLAKSDRGRWVLLLTAGAATGFTTALLAKTVYLLLPFACTALLIFYRRYGGSSWMDAVVLRDLRLQIAGGGGACSGSMVLSCLVRDASYSR